MRMICYSLLALLPLVQCTRSSEPQPTSTTSSSGTHEQSTQLDGAAETIQDNQSTATPPAIPLTPMEAIKDLDHKVESYRTGQGLSEADLQFNKKLKQEIINGTFDIRELCRLALDIHWNELTDKDHDYFSNLMTQLLERKAIFSKEQVKGTNKPYRIEYLKEQFLNGDKHQSKVITKLFVPSEKIDLDISYLLKWSQNIWQIYDVIVDDASLVANYKYQFHAIIQKSGYQDLVSRMEKKLKEME